MFCYFVILQKDRTTIFDHRIFEVVLQLYIENQLSSKCISPIKKYIFSYFTMNLGDEKYKKTLLLLRTKFNHDSFDFLYNKHLFCNFKNQKISIIFKNDKQAKYELHKYSVPRTLPPT